jgi:acyl-CoA dehydrogenase
MQVDDRVEAVREAAREVAKKYDREYWLGCARDHRFTSEMWTAMGESGLLSLGVPEELGGAGGGFAEVVALMETMSEAGVPQDFLVITGLARVPIMAYGSPAQIDKYVKPTLTGESSICFAITESEAGTNTFKIKTTARRTPLGWTLSGQKIFITGADVCEHMLVVARAEDGDATETDNGLSLFLLDTNAPGITKTPLNIGVGFPEEHFIVFFDDVQLPADAIVGERGRGIKHLFDALNPERLMVAAKAVGIGNYALAKAVAYANERAPFGKPIGSYQSVQHPLAHARASLDAARLMMYKAVEVLDNGGKAGPLANMAKLLASEACVEAVDALVKIHGGNAFDNDYDVLSLLPVSRLMVNAPINNDMVLNYIAEHIMGMPKSY